MADVGIKTVGDIYVMDLATLESHFGGWGTRLFQLARGIDHNPVVSNRVRKQISAEDTFPDDIPLAECEPHIRRLAEKVWTASQANARRGRTVVLKLKTKEFSSLTRSLTPPSVPITCEDFTDLGLHLCSRVDLDARQLYRLVGIGLSNFEVEGDVEPETAALIDSLSRASLGLIGVEVTAFD
jgi:DNA polymerase-4